MGLDPKAKQVAVYISGPRAKDSTEIPRYLSSQAPDVAWAENSSVTLENRQKVEKGDFVKSVPVTVFQLANAKTVTQVTSIWKPDGGSATKTVILLQETQQGPVYSYYGMREIIVTMRQRWVRVQVSTLNSPPSHAYVWC
ncbi:uncharacterized protein MELLADRAFT_85586 [Melampsora larici-populina 98AG31]|uniref:Uncharacterized protein n=1 Tax=Melampsora larici-populina (strain 98AG31 / pathotype 3-4-7) TaxID=747676 RepID=F4RZ82_MELLP|nr:uncharacterized protein MELLADRAFT_91491 [Melampsora larici-populina 98AG31]XP_007419325.1 uncharacterized protein MELLADRAFT_85586 [Melampsora larici-populina 98AG31]EGF97404.1 hypothetical protein MELLADRAFT_85586 [Melampsora larici-populina 98AG31]EGG02179.1 hypothetical protein MELLADRAFT_91491 [Melampsora larici-populina 98AG31]